MDRFSLARDFELAKFEMEIMRCDDLYELQVIAIKLFSQTMQQRQIYERLLRDGL